MKAANTISTKAKLVRFVTAVLMCGCLLFLTGINFFVYGSGKQVCMVEQQPDSDEPEEKAPEKPVEEKSSNTSNIQEEYVHELHLQQGFAATGESLKYNLLDEAKLAIVHFELTSPPPDL
ncbi:MAG TPA: hypothetical protein DCQ97_09915 [Chitinophagaceae bacterium]|nr:hypothetical protein [Chitinophagaceae bacterium]